MNWELIITGIILIYVSVRGLLLLQENQRLKREIMLNARIVNSVREMVFMTNGKLWATNHDVSLWLSTLMLAIYPPEKKS